MKYIRIMRQIGPYSRPKALEKLDGRTRNGRLLNQKRAEFTAHVGGKPSATQRVLIERCAWLSLHIALIDEKALDGGNMTAHDSRTYLAWCNSLTRLMRQIGMTGAAQRPPSLADHLARQAAA